MGEVGGMNWGTETGVYTLPYIREIAGGKLLNSMGAQLGALWSPKWAGLGWGLGGRSKRQVIQVHI